MVRGQLLLELSCLTRARDEAAELGRMHEAHALIGRCHLISRLLRLDDVALKAKAVRGVAGPACRSLLRHLPIPGLPWLCRHILLWLPCRCMTVDRSECACMHTWDGCLHG